MFASFLLLVLGNALSVTIIEAIGVGLAIIIWSMANQLFGFATSRGVLFEMFAYK